MSKTVLIPLILFALVLTVGTGLALFAPLSLLLSNFVPDDSFYYFKIALNVASSHGSSFDGVTLTNGYHPLWMLILAASYHIFHPAAQSAEPIRIALEWAALFTAAGIPLLFRLCYRLTSSVLAACLACAFYIFNPFVFYESFNGLETALLLFMLLAWLNVVSTLKKDGSYGTFFLAGVLSGLLVLSRLDSLLYVLAFFAWLLWQRTPVKNIFVAAAGTGATLVPYMYWMFAVFGSLIPSSAVSNTLGAQDTLIGAGAFQYLHLYGTFLFNSVERLFVYVGAGPVICTLLGIALGIVIARRSSWNAAITPEVGFYIIAGCACLLVFLANCARLMVRDWYLVPFEIFVALGLAWAVSILIKENTARFILPAGCLAAAMLFVWSWNTTLQNRQAVHGGSLAFVEAADWINTNIPQTARVGVFDAGIVGYFSKSTVINLDGLVNQEAYSALKNRELLSYVSQAGISYVIAPKEYIDSYAPRWGGSPRDRLSLVTTIGQTELSVYSFK